MKKIARAFLFVALLSSALTLLSCKKKQVYKDECECFLDFEDAKTFAKKADQNILLLVTSRGDDYISQQFIDDVLMSESFQDSIALDYVVCHFDFSQYSYEKTVVPEDATKEEKEHITHYAELMQAGYQKAVLLDCQYTPAIFLFTKEGFVISEVDYTDEILTVEDFSALLSQYDDLAAHFEELVDATKKGSNIEKVRAIDKLNNETPEKYRSMLIELTKTIPDLDKNNESGLCSKYIVDAAEAKAIELYSKGDIASAVQSYVSACDNKFIEPEEKQECYYMAAYLLASTGSDDYQVILSYLNSALAACPDGDKVQYINSAMEYYKQQEEEKAKAAEEAAKNPQEESK